MRGGKTGFLGIPAGRGTAAEGAVEWSGGERPWPLEKWLIRRLMAAMGNPPIRVTFWDGESVRAQGSAGEPAAGLVVRDRGALWRLLYHPELHFGDDYTAGRLAVEGGEVEFLEAVFRARPYIGAGDLMRKLQFLTRASRNTLAGSRRNIHHHYNIGNAFYRLWLDAEMAYTCAYYATPEATLEQAQVAKMDHVCRKLRLQPGERVLEAGCGWGALARHMARHYGVTVKAYNISREQVRYARERAAAEGLDPRIEYVEADYRDAAGEFDAFVSVGMLEHVGVENYAELGGVIDRCLTENGRGLVHTIGKNQPSPMTAWAEKRIFPGAYPPTLAEMMHIFEPYAFSVLDVENLRLHYAHTLRDWLARFDRHATQVEGMFDRQFVRAWRLYLASSIASFTSGSLQLFQVLFSRPKCNDVPMTRAHLYGENHGAV